MTRIYGMIGDPFTKHGRRRDCLYFLILISNKWSAVFFPYNKIFYTFQTLKQYVSPSASVKYLRISYPVSKNSNQVFYLRLQTTTRHATVTINFNIHIGKTVLSETVAICTLALVRVRHLHLIFTICATKSLTARGECV